MTGTAKDDNDLIFFCKLKKKEYIFRTLSLLSSYMC